MGGGVMAETKVNSGFFQNSRNFFKGGSVKIFIDSLCISKDFQKNSLSSINVNQLNVEVRNRQDTFLNHIKTNDSAIVDPTPTTRRGGGDCNKKVK